MRKFETARFQPAFELGERVRVNAGVPMFGNQIGVVEMVLSADGYLIRFLDDDGEATFERRELSAVKA